MEAYFAYGSNLCFGQFKKRCPSAVAVSRAFLVEHRLVFPRRSSDWAGGVAGVEPHPTAHVEGVVYQLHACDFAALDDYEGVDQRHYWRTRVTVRLPQGRALPCWTYYAHREPGGPFAPSAQYVRTLIDGARHHGLSKQSIDAFVGLLTGGRGDALGVHRPDSVATLRAEVRR